MAFTEPTEGELQTASEIADARRTFLSEPPPILDPNEPEPVVDDAAEEAAALDELTQPPAAPEGGTPPPPAPAPSATPDHFVIGHDDHGNPITTSREQAYTAWQVQEALRSEQGLRALVGQGLTALGYDLQQITAALDGAVEPEAPAPTGDFDPLAGLEDDDVLDVKTARNIAAWAAQQAAEQAVAATAPAVQSVQDAVLAAQQSQVRSFTDHALVEVLGQPPADPTELANYQRQVDILVQRGNQYYDPNQAHDPNHIRQVVQRAHAEFVQEQEAAFHAYLANKKRVRDSQPVNVGGGAGSEGPLPEPKNMAEAREQARQTGFFK